jgi:hypothetical protein
MFYIEYKLANYCSKNHTNNALLTSCALVNRTTAHKFQQAFNLEAASNMSLQGSSSSSTQPDADEDENLDLTQAEDREVFYGKYSITIVGMQHCTYYNCLLCYVQGYLAVCYSSKANGSCSCIYHHVQTQA